MGRAVREPAARRSAAAGDPGLVMGMMLIFLTVGIKSFRQALLILGVVPLATLGGLISLHLTGQNLNVASGVGFIALFGVAVQNGIIMVSNLNRMRKSGLELHEAIMKGATERLAAGLDDGDRGDLGDAARGHPHRRRQRRAARHRHRRRRRARDLHRPHAVRAAFDVPRHRALGRAARRSGAVGSVMTRSPVPAPHRRCARGRLAAPSCRPRRVCRRTQFQAPAPPAAAGYGDAPDAGRDRSSRERGRRRAALRRRHGYSRPMVDAVQVAQAQSSGRAGAQGQSGRRRRAGGAAAGSRAVSGATDQLLSDRPGELQRHPRQERRRVRIANPTSLPQSNPYYNLYTAQLTVSYCPDVFGATRRAVEEAKAQEQSTRFQLEATYLTLSSNVVVTAVQEASLRGQIDRDRAACSSCSIS